MSDKWVYAFSYDVAHHPLLEGVKVELLTAQSKVWVEFVARTFVVLYDKGMK